uniref:CCHC-type domain-containing protein n=1 Tax=Anser cygnoides TaxID=8845 RepID=A0A8B9ERN9_ANSCY
YGETVCSPLGCVLTHWKDIVGTGGTESKKTLIKYCDQWWPLYKLEDGAKWPLNGMIDYNTLLQLMLFLRREGKWDEVSYADMFFTLQNHPEWQRDCGMIPPQDPMVLALERDNSEDRKGKLKRCCSACSIGQQCTKAEKVHQPLEQDLVDLFKPPPKPQEQDTDSEEPPTPPGSPVPPPPNSPVSSRTRKKSASAVLQAPLREAVGPEGGTMLIKVPFSTTDLGEWKRVAKDYRNDSVSVTKHFQFIIKQHNPDWKDIQLLLDYMTETEKQLILKAARSLAEDYYKIIGEDVKEYFPLQDLKWNPNRTAEMDRLQAYQEWVSKGMEKAIPKAINWSALYAVKQGPAESPSEFLDRLRDIMGIQQLVSLFLGQSTGDIKCKLQKLCQTESRNLEINREEEYRQGQKKLIAVIKEEGRRRSGQKQSRLGKDQCAKCKRFGHWKNECPEQRRNKKGSRRPKVCGGIKPNDINKP